MYRQDSRITFLTGFFVDKILERTYKRYIGFHYRRIFLSIFVIIGILNTLMVGVDMRNIPLADGWVLFIMRLMGLAILLMVGRYLYRGGMNYIYCRVIFLVVLWIALVTLYRYDILFSLQHTMFDFTFQVGALLVLYSLCGSMLMLPLLSIFVLVFITGGTMVLHAIYYEQNMWDYRIWWALYTFGTVIIVSASYWYRYTNRKHFFHRHIKTKSYIRALAKNRILDKMQNVFMATQTAQFLVHELRSPLATAMGYAQMSGDENMSNSLERMNDITDNIAHMGRGEYNMQYLDMRSVLKRASDLWFNTLKEGRRSVHISGDMSHNYPVQADDILLQGAIANVVRNGLQVHDKSTVQITLEQDTNDVIVRISNDRPRPVHLNDDIFIPLMSTRDTDDAKPDTSMGVGLAFTHYILEQFGGKITLDMQVENSTDFVIHLPYVAKCPQGIL